MERGSLYRAKRPSTTTSLERPRGLLKPKQVAAWSRPVLPSRRCCWPAWTHQVVRLLKSGSNNYHVGQRKADHDWPNPTVFELRDHGYLSPTSLPWKYCPSAVLVMMIRTHMLQGARSCGRLFVILWRGRTMKVLCPTLSPYCSSWQIRWRSICLLLSIKGLGLLHNWRYQQLLNLLLVIICNRCLRHLFVFFNPDKNLLPYSNVKDTKKLILPTTNVANRITTV